MSCPTLDLFSGTGGVSYALRGGIARTVAYCEACPDARAILEGNMASGNIDRAPVLEDVRTLDPGALPDVELIAGGFPCVGLSRAGRREGLAHPASALFYRVVEIAEALRPPLIFLENVSTIVDNGVLEEIEAQLHGKLGYEVRWITLPAYAVGAPQIRERWYALAVRPGYARTWTLDATPTFDWSVQPPRMVPVGSEPGATARKRALGNGVVPDAVRLAFMFLASGGRVTALSSQASTLILQPMVAARFSTANSSPCMLQTKKPDLGLRLTPDGGGAATNPAIKTAVIVREHRLRMWATPRFKNQGANAVLTYRGTQDLPTQMKFEAGTPLHQRGAGYRPSVCFYEWLMGVPNGFTSSSTSRSRRPSSCARNSPKLQSH